MQDDDADAPRDVLVVRDLVNTVEWQEDDESWATPAALGAWLADRWGEIAAPTERDLVLARRIREGLREVLLDHAGHDARQWALDDLNDALRHVPVALRFAGPRPAVTTSAVEAARSPLAPLVVAVDAATRDPGWHRLKACSRDTCRWAYWDPSRNSSKRWCSMEGCGNYVKMRRRNGSTSAAGDALPLSGEAPRPVTLLDVAIRAGVSTKTVSNVVNDAPHVSDGMRARVQTAIDALEYRPNLAARALAKARASEPSRGE